MSYTIKQASELTNLTPVTLRYYDKQGLLLLWSGENPAIECFPMGTLLC